MATFSDTMDDWWHNLTNDQQLKIFSEYRKLMPAGKSVPMYNEVLDDWDNIRLCEVCHDRECVAPATKCHACRTQEMIDND